MDNFDQIFVEATAELPSEYFYLRMHNAPAMYKERVYCYELYHQLRRRWPEATPLRLNGEVDKARHPDFSQRRMIADFLVHERALPTGRKHQYPMCFAVEAIRLHLSVF
jgi:hypothetical protein